MPTEHTSEHPPLNTYRPGDCVVITCRGHRFEGETFVVIGYNGCDICVHSGIRNYTDYFCNSTSLSPVRRVAKRPISPIFYHVKEPSHVVG